MAHGDLLIALGPLVVIAIMAALMASADRPHRGMAAAFFILAVLIYVVPVGGRGAWVMTRLLGERYASAHMHYSVAPVFLLASAVALLLDGAGRARQVARTLFALHAALLIVIDFRVTISRSAGPRWGDALDAAARRCVSQPADYPVAVPTDRYGVFRVMLTCRDVDDGSPRGH